jgi:hypothetical protein
MEEPRRELAGVFHQLATDASDNIRSKRPLSEPEVVPLAWDTVLGIGGAGLRVATNKTPSTPAKLLGGRSSPVGLRPRLRFVSCEHCEIFSASISSVRLSASFGPVDALLRTSDFQRQNIGRHPVAVGFQAFHHDLLTHGGAVCSLTSAVRMTRLLSRSGSRALGLPLVAGVVLDDRGMMPIVMAGGDRTGEDGVRPMMPATVVIKGKVAVAAMMKPLTVLIDDCVAVFVAIMMMSVARDDHISFSRRSYSRGRHEKRHSANDHCFSLQFLRSLNWPSDR